MMPGGYPPPSYVPRNITYIRSTLMNIKKDAKNCYACDKFLENISWNVVKLLCVVEGDFEGHPIYSVTIDALFCWECFESSSDDLLLNHFNSIKNIPLMNTNNRCIYCKEFLEMNYYKLDPYYVVEHSIEHQINPISHKCNIHEECYKKHIGIGI